MLPVRSSVEALASCSRRRVGRGLSAQGCTGLPLAQQPDYERQKSGEPMTDDKAPQPRRSRWPLWLLGAAVVAGLALLLDPTHTLLGHLRGETFYEGRPSSYWAAALASQ